MKPSNLFTKLIVGIGIAVASCCAQAADTPPPGSTFKIFKLASWFDGPGTFDCSGLR